MQNPANSRRNFLKLSSLSGAAYLAAPAFAHTPLASTAQVQAQSQSTIPFYGRHQAGILTPAQKHIYFLVADLHEHSREKIQHMFQTWTQYAANLTRGKAVKDASHNLHLPPTDTGENADLNSSRLTLTFGISPSFLDKLGLNAHRPAVFKDLPHFPRDQLKAPYTGGDICIQACADDPQVAFHAVRNLVRAARLNLNLRWSQSGFNSFTHESDTPRNLFAFKDGTANPTGELADALVWSDEDNWLKDGTYLIARRIQMFVETWDRTSLQEQHNTFGRNRATGAAIGQQNEHDPVNLSLTDEDGNLLIDEDSHVRLAHATGRQILRRSFSYASGIDSKGQFDTGLLFISYQKDPQAFIDIQNAFGNNDKLNEYITHVGSGIFACFAGVSEEKGDYLGRALFELSA